jgi:tetratricopeptide (TPR) repeat protein
MSILSSWLTKAVLTQTAQAIYRSLVDSGLLARCAKRAEEWCRELPPDATLHSIEMFFQSDSKFGLNNLPPGPTKALEAIERGEIPTNQIWLDDLLTQWEWVRENVEEPQPFFTLDQDTTRAHLAKLAALLHEECVKDPTLFQLDTHKMVTGIGEDVQEIRQMMYTLFAKSVMPRATTAETISSKSDSNFHADIEAACAYIEQGQPKLAITALEDLEQKHWPELNSHERYRLVANRGIAKTELGNIDAAARDFIECVQYEPEEEKPRCWAANGNLILGHRDECASLVKDILVDFPESTFAYALRVYSAPEDAAFPELEGLVPDRHRDAPEVAIALSERAAAGKLMDIAEAYARRACKGESPHPMAKYRLGMVIVESTIRRTRPLLSESPPVDEDRLREGVAFLKSSLDAFTTRGETLSQALCHFHLGRAYHFLGTNALRDGESSEDELRAAFVIQPTEPCFCTQYALALHDNDRIEEAINILEKASANDDSLNATVLAAQFLNNRRASGDIQRAISLLDAAQAKFPGDVSSANTEYISVLADVYCADNKKQDAIDIINRLIDSFESVEKQALLGLTARKTDDKETAQTLILSAAEAVDSDTDIWTRHLIAVELLSLKLYQDAFTILREHVTDTCMSLDTWGLVIAAQQSGQDGFLLRFLNRLREAGVVETQFMDLELGLLERYHAGLQCIEVVQHLLDTNVGDEEFRSELRIRLSFLGIVYDRPELVEHDISRLPRADSTTPDIGAMVVELLIQQGHFEKSQEYAYTLLRSNFQAKKAHQALIAAYLLERNADAPPSPDTVVPGTAFHYTEDGVPGEKFAIIEDGPSPSMERNEYDANHHIFKNAIGKMVGECFTLRDTGFQQTEGTILRIHDKKVFRFNMCIQEYERRFDDSFLVKVRMPKDEEGNFDFEPIRKAMEQHANAIAERDKIYRSYPLSVSIYAMLSHANIVDVIGHMANERLPIRCCAGTGEEETLALEVLEHDARLVLDPSAVATLVHTRTTDLLQALPIKLIIPRGLLIRMREEIERKVKFSGNTLSCVDSRLVFTEVTEEQKLQWIDRLRDTVDALETNGEVVDGLPLADETPDLRNQWTQLFGWDIAEAIAIAKHYNATIWTDDFLVSRFAAEHAGVQRVWTEVVYKWASKNDAIPHHRFVDIVADLVDFGYWHTKLFPEVAIKMASDSEWDFQRRPFKHVIEWMGSAGVSASTIGALAEKLLPRIYRSQNEFIGSATVQAVLGSINKRYDGRSIIRELRRRVSLYCGVNFPIEKRLAQDMDIFLNPRRLD